MPFARLDREELLRLLGELGGRLTWPTEIEIVLIGGAAGILTGQLHRRVTSDCDVPFHAPKDAWDEIRRHAIDIARAWRLSETWLNAEVRGLAHRLPDGWRARAEPIGRFDTLVVTAIGRLDLIAMKFMAGRAEDREDLTALRVTAREAEFVHDYLVRLVRTHPHERDHVADARVLLAHGGLVVA